MREIKFRAWDNKIKQMLKDIQDAVGCPRCAEEFDLPLVYGDDAYVFADFLNNKQFKLMQYTGLHDQNGKEIYEGDIILISGKFKIDIRFGLHVWTDPDGMEQKGWGFFGRFEDDSGDCRLYPDKTIEVIGNIYENPELMGEDAE